MSSDFKWCLHKVYMDEYLEITTLSDSQRVFVCVLCDGIRVKPRVQ